MDRSIFQKVAKSNASNKGDNLRDGKGRLLVLQNNGFRGNDGATFVAKFKVLESMSKGDKDPITKEPILPNAPGSTPGWVAKLEKHKSAPGNVKAYTLNLLGLKETEVSVDAFAQAMEDMISTKQPARGMLIDYETYQQEIKGGPNKGKVITLVRFAHVTEANGNDPKSIAARRAELDKTDPVVELKDFE